MYPRGRRGFPSPVLLLLQLRRCIGTLCRNGQFFTTGLPKSLAHALCGLDFPGNMFHGALVALSFWNISKMRWRLSGSTWYLIFWFEADSPGTDLS